MMPNSQYEENLISLLNYALDKKGVDPALYFIGTQGDEKKIDDRLCLLRDGDGRWIVLYSERGSISQKSVHYSIKEAASDFFWRLTRKDTAWVFREEWEKESGKSF